MLRRKLAGVHSTPEDVLEDESGTFSDGHVGDSGCGRDLTGDTLSLAELRSPVSDH